MTAAAQPWPPDVTLEDARVRLEMLATHHAGDLAAASADGDLSALWVTNVPSPEHVPQAIERCLELRAASMMLPFAAIERASGRAMGMTTYIHIDAEMPRRLEIGATWYAASVQRTGFNASCKRLLLGHAFEKLDCIAVEFRTHFLNQASRRAIERLGAKLDGVLRNHTISRNGTLRDTCVYSITASEWPAVRALLDDRIAASASKANPSV